MLPFHFSRNLKNVKNLVECCKSTFQKYCHVQESLSYVKFLSRVYVVSWLLVLFCGLTLVFPTGLIVCPALIPITACGIYSLRLPLSPASLSGHVKSENHASSYHAPYQVRFCVVWFFVLLSFAHSSFFCCCTYFLQVVVSFFCVVFLIFLCKSDFPLVLLIKECLFEPCLSSRAFGFCS